MCLGDLAKQMHSYRISFTMCNNAPVVLLHSNRIGTTLSVRNNAHVGHTCRFTMQSAPLSSLRVVLKSIASLCKNSHTAAFVACGKLCAFWDKTAGCKTIICTKCWTKMRNSHTLSPHSINTKSSWQFNDDKLQINFLKKQVLSFNNWTTCMLCWD